MKGFDVYGVIPQFTPEEFADWMVKHRFGDPAGVKSRAPALSPLASQVVISEYEMGTDFSWIHDMTVGTDGNIWAGDYTLDKLYKLNTRTGQVQSYNYPVKGAGAHTLNPDKDGNIWTTLQLADLVARFNPRTEEWSVFGGLSKGSLVHTFAVDEFGELYFDENGNLWMSEFGRHHLASLNPSNRTAKEYELPVPQISAFKFVPSPYGIAYNRKDGRIWYSQIGVNVVGNIDPKTGQVKQYSMPEEWMGPRRLKVGPDGRVWVPLYSTGEIGALDPNTATMKRYKLPHPGDTPYALAVNGATGIVWICGTSSDSIYRFDPKTEQFVTMPLPSRTAFTRMIDVDYLTGDLYTSYSNFPNAQGEHVGGVVVRIQLPAALK
jgi:streptogramin lyase